MPNVILQNLIGQPRESSLSRLGAIINFLSVWAGLIVLLVANEKTISSLGRDAIMVFICVSFGITIIVAIAKHVGHWVDLVENWKLRG